MNLRLNSTRTSHLQFVCASLHTKFRTSLKRKFPTFFSSKIILLKPSIKSVFEFNTNLELFQILLQNCTYKIIFLYLFFHDSKAPVIAKNFKSRFYLMELNVICSAVTQSVCSFNHTHHLY